MEENQSKNKEENSTSKIYETTLTLEYLFEVAQKLSIKDQEWDENSREIL